MEKEIKRLDFLKDVLEVAISVVVLTFVLTTFILIPVQVDGQSMVPTLLDKERGYSFIITKNLGVKRFDIGVLNVNDEKLLVKRCIGLPGETIEFRDNKLYVNGEFMEQEFLEDDVVTNDYEITLGEDEYFFMGDNRSHSRDSRYYGPFSLKDIRATKLFVVFPFSKFGMK